MAIHRIRAGEKQPDKCELHQQKLEEMGKWQKDWTTLSNIFLVLCIVLGIAGYFPAAFFALGLCIAFGLISDYQFKRMETIHRKHVQNDHNRGFGTHKRP